MNSVERMLEYEKYDTEAPAHIPESTVPKLWPQAGAIEVKDLWVRYREGLDPVLRGVSFSVMGQEKVRRLPVLGTRTRLDARSSSPSPPLCNGRSECAAARAVASLR